MTSIHKTVLLNETIDGLKLKPDSVILDATFGGGGHSMGILNKFPKVKIIALDQDTSVWNGSNLPAQADNQISFHNENFRDLDKVLESEKVDGIIFDLGLSSDQLENSGRGFSFVKDEPLLMQMKNSAKKSTKEDPSPEYLTASEVVNTWEEESLSQIIYGYGEEKFSRRIAKAIVDARAKAEIKTTFDLVKIIEGSVGNAYKRQKIHPATRTFQALRIAVNDELGALKEGLDKGFDALANGRRMAVISFHSLEDRIVKRFYKSKEKEGKVILINKKPITAGADELKNNPRARSAKLRIFEKI
jgi:16S rRNA (cytosine1402-N4)-methyltransferase